MSTKPARPRNLLRYLTITSITMIVMGLCGFVAIAIFIIPNHSKVISTLKSHGVQTHANVTRCQQALHDENGGELSVTCWVRFTPSGGRSVESPLQFKTHQVRDGYAMIVVYDPNDTGTVALPSDLGYWNTLTRNTIDLLLLFISAAMVPLGIAGIALRRLCGRFTKRYTENFDEIDQIATQRLGPDVAQAMAQVWTRGKPSGK
ncbi:MULTISPECIES: DUF3592 domain-containing protein [unclassified Streptomyces]|uniref:DUF3592 domain-containing protein n=1 Tax=unclassified Streptomyces TaxID=2593676 RepID=UPI00225AD915|nr:MULTISPECIES: DUF3592 domain-containing protein [unclassified Streptomyces]MCX4792906.1 hypothetical protein [Streptomyces sp. NBC_01242]WSP59590.1 hypothetical protein OG306_38460 [Streptomyces sp. NBC_01241]WSP60813.1 hypothetical protein OG466_01975 [Streptomyces sp. NBC_01240]WSU19890.1 hypothetical protein OG508_01910 [Streptomyces sp. NBC_01108]